MYQKFNNSNTESIAENILYILISEFVVIVTVCVEISHYGSPAQLDQNTHIEINSKLFYLKLKCFVFL